MTKKKSTDAVENTEPIEFVSDSDTALDTVETANAAKNDSNNQNNRENFAELKAEKKNIPKKYIYVGASLPGNALKNNTVFDGTFEEVCVYLQSEINAYPLVKELLIPVKDLASSGSSTRISSLKRALLKSIERRH